MLEASALKDFSIPPYIFTHQKVRHFSYRHVSKSKFDVVEFDVQHQIRPRLKVIPLVWCGSLECKEGGNSCVSG
ncbi:hypothetical protein TNCV_2372091 [Trichonephila clavipes]|nr:hypothetical protein TNCV_2372091 [Trichonephila clavipes]